VPNGLFTGLFVPEAVAEATSDEAWIAAILEFEAALAGAEAEAGLIPADAAEAIAAACDPETFDAAEIGRAGRDSANPVIPLISGLRERLGEDAAGHVHRGATSQDAMDTAAMLVAKRARTAIDAELARVASSCAELAERHRTTPMAGRTLLQQAVPITFGLKAAGWLDEVLDVRERLASASLATQLGGAAGTLAPLGAEGTRVLALLAARLELDEPALPWHANRIRVADLGAALALAAGAAERIALDVVLLAQTEVGEVMEASAGGRGGSSAMPHKRNPVGSVLAIACARRARGAAGVLLAAVAQEHERAAGAWQSEWESLRDALAMAGGAAAGAREALEALEVRPERMRANLESTGGLVMTESLVTSLAERVGAARARELIDAAAARAIDAETTLREQLTGDQAIAAELSEEEIDRALDPAAALGSADAFVERALSRYGGDRGR
jgi:3-carboxy-cis,cis-muconate cycloisomerase